MKEANLTSLLTYKIHDFEIESMLIDSRTILRTLSKTSDFFFLII